MPNAANLPGAFAASRALVMKTTLLDHLSLGPYKESVTIVQIQMPFHTVGCPSGGLYAPDGMYARAWESLHRLDIFLG